MSEIFLTILNMSLTASYVILFVILIRLPLKKAPKIISYALWAVVAFRLIIPFSFESIFSLLPRNINTTTIPQDIVYQQNPQINSGIESVNSFINGMLPAPTIGASVNPLEIYTQIGTYIWVLGMMALLVYSLVSILLLRRQLKNARLIRQNIYEAENLKTPFVLGFVRPKIYLPVGLSVEERRYILLHEHTHIRRYDHIIKPFALFILSIHWFNPLVWVAFILMSMELSCDERVLKELVVDIKKSYANSLLSLAAGRDILNGGPLAFGEGNVKLRIKNVLNYKKPKFWVIVSAVIMVVGVCVGLITNPQTISLPEVDVVQLIEMERFNEGSSLGQVTVTSSGNMEVVLSNLLGAKRTMRQSVNGYPAENNYLIIRLILQGERRTLYLYSDDGSYYIEEPYVGIYKSSRGESDAIYKAYTGNVNTTQTLVPSEPKSLPEFSEAEVAAARSVVKEYFRAIAAKDDEAILKTLTSVHRHPNTVLYGDETRTLLSIDYDENDSMRKSYAENGRGGINGTKIENVIVFKVNFNVAYPKGV